MCFVHFYPAEYHLCIILYLPTYESAASYGPSQRPPHPTKLESTCPESGCLYFANTVVVESSLLPFCSSLFVISPFHLLFQFVANLRNPAVLEPLCSQLLMSLSCLQCSSDAHQLRLGSLSIQDTSPFGLSG
jgi:hypothetical protein